MLSKTEVLEILQKKVEISINFTSRLHMLHPLVIRPLKFA